MSFWKILAGAATGVVTVVALPIAGPVGAITAVGAAVAGTVGATGGAAIDALEEQAEKRGREQEKAKQALKSEKLLRAIKEMESRAAGRDQFFSQLIAIFAAGIACANCDGDIDPAERTEIDEFVAGINHSNLPNDVKEKVDELWQNPPSIRTAFKLAEQAKIEDLSLVDDVIDLVMHADNRVHAEEKAFMNAWHKLRNS